MICEKVCLNTELIDNKETLGRPYKNMSRKGYKMTRSLAI